MKGFMNMFTNDQFKSLLIKTLERKSSSNYYEGGNEIVSKMKISEVTLDETDDFTYYKGYKKGWNTLCTYLKIRVPFDDLDFLWLQLDQNLFKKESRGSALLPISGSRYGDSTSEFEGGYKIKSVQIDGKEAKYTVSDTRMQIDLINHLKARGGKTKIKIE